jgi:DNA-binding CsgD family transcriptional regulator
MLRAAPASIWSQIPWLRVRSRLGITPQQMVIVRHILERDLTTAAIARAMGISLSSVGTQLERLFDKLEVRSRTAMATRVLTEVIAMMGEEGGSPGAGGEEGK